MEIIFSLEWGQLFQSPTRLAYPRIEILKTQETFKVQELEKLRLTLQEITPSYE